MLFHSLLRSRRAIVLRAMDRSAFEPLKMLNRESLPNEPLFSFSSHADCADCKKEFLNKFKRIIIKRDCFFCLHSSAGYCLPLWSGEPEPSALGWIAQSHTEKSSEEKETSHETAAPFISI